MARLMIQRRGEPPEELELAPGGALADGWAAGALAVVARAPDGVVVEASLPARADGRELPPGLRRLLRPGDRVEIGDRTVWLEREAADEHTRALAGAILSGAMPAPLRGPALLVLEGASAGARLPVSHGAVLGRGEGADLRVDDPLASRRHLRLSLRGAALVAEDLASKNGFAVAGRRRRRARLRPGESLTVGGTVLLVLDRAATPSPDAPDALPALPPAGRARAAVAALAGGLLLAAALALAAAAT